MPFEPLPLLRPLWLLALPAAGLLAWWLARRRARAGGWADLIDPHLRPALLGPPQPAGRWPVAWLLGLGLTLLVLALAGPAWRWVERPLFRIEQARVLVLDLSPTMDRADLPPSRLGRARFELLDLLGAADEGQTGLIAYGAEPFLIAPLTSDAATIAAQLPALTTDILPLTGQPRPDLALDLALTLLSSAGAATGQVILLTDGAADPSDALPLARRLRTLGHRLDVLALQADTAALEPWRRLAAAGGGGLVPARLDDADLLTLVPTAADAGRLRGAADERARPRRRADDGPWLLVALLPLAALAGRRGWFGAWGGLGLPLLLVLALTAPASQVPAAEPAPKPAAPGAWWANLWQRPDQQRLKALRAGDLGAASGPFADPLWQAGAHYQAGQYQQALDLLRGETGSIAHYNRGNALARLGRWREAVAEYQAALDLAPDHRDARHNRDLLLGLLAPTASGSDRAVGDRATPPAAGAASAREAAGALAPSDGQQGTAPPDPAGTRPGPAAGPAADRQGPAPAAESTREPGPAEELPPQALAPLLRQIQDDPGGLLRERLRLQYLRRHGQLY